MKVSSLLHEQKIGVRPSPEDMKICHVHISDTADLEGIFFLNNMY